MVATLLATRYVLQALGEEEYGIYMLLGSMVALFSFLNITMAATIQRFLSYALGENDVKKVKEIFYMSLMIHLVLSLIVVVLLSVGGFYAISHLLDIDPTYHNSARLVLICLSGGILVIINSVPFEAAMNAHEDISMIAFINILEAALKLLSALMLLFVDKWGMVEYALFVFLAQMIAFVCKFLYARSRYEEAHFTFHRLKDRILLKQLFGFAGWNLIGAGCGIARYQGAAVLLNVFFGVFVNAAYGVAQQVNGFLLFFAGSIVRPFRPVVIKTEGAGNHEQTVRLSLLVCRIAFLMVSLAVIPLYVNMPYILSIWLDDVPDGALFFTRMFLLIVLINQATVGLQLAIESGGNIRRLQLYVGSMHIVAIPVGLLLFSLGFSAESIMYCIVVEEIVCTFLRIWIAKLDAGVPMVDSYFKTLLPEVSSFVVAFLIVYATHSCFESGVVAFVSTSLLALFCIILVGYTICFSNNEKNQIRQTLGNLILNKLKR